MFRNNPRSILFDEPSLPVAFRRNFPTLAIPHQPEHPANSPTNAHIETTEDQKSCTEFHKITATSIDSTPKFDSPFEHTIPPQNNHRSSRRSKSSSKNALPKGPARRASSQRDRFVGYIARLFGTLRSREWSRIFSSFPAAGTRRTRRATHRSRACVRAWRGTKTRGVRAHSFSKKKNMKREGGRWHIMTFSVRFVLLSARTRRESDRNGEREKESRARARGGGRGSRVLRVLCPSALNSVKRHEQPPPAAFPPTASFPR